MFFTDTPLPEGVYLDFFNHTLPYFNRLLDPQVELLISALSRASEHGLSAVYLHYFTGQIYYQRRCYERAMSAFQSSWESDPLFEQAYAFHALCYEDQEQLHDAQEIYKSALKATPHSLMLNNNFAYLLLRMERYEEALSYAKWVVARSGDESYLHTYAVILYKLNQRLEYAEEQLRRVHRAGISVAQLHLAELYALRSDRRKAKIWFKKFQKSRDQIEELRDNLYVSKQMEVIADQISRL